MKSWKKPLKFITILLVIIIGLVGCRTAKRPINERTKTTTEKATERTTEETAPAKSKTPPSKTQTAVNEEGKIQKDIAEEVKKVKDVKEATVLIHDKTAYVGVELVASLKGNEKEITRIKDEIIEKVKKRDTNITTVHVSEEEHVSNRLRDYVRDVEQGKPITGFITELEEMFRKPVPRT
ncbi:YhcN/YlaJ family sporulation lipoprotein [Alkaliphilus sp. B6464]|uniref:YhcN/YlaJ family sporulation lipoprotein n=1 Tax=Alkaliphilus sp. B6464 TaxID=2731219 RepID=UPI001BA445A9|nr:YhcN/YlaJ family sporulation lipoprotein [Alkaliphilus sp. B6464]QUH19914.1 YhcN/YlaJ family sporulation lipoprotein [Alkaliphilus sp. B6464]